MELDDAAWTLLHELRLRGSVATADVDAPAAVETLVALGFVSEKPRAIVMTATGRARHEAWARVAIGSPSEAALRIAYERFLPLNAELLRICSDWQVHAGGTNDHADAEYDWAVLDRLRRLHERAAPVTRAMERATPRFAVHRTRLRVALARVDDGDVEWFTSPRVDSYHTVWMHLHEDVLLALGIDRAREVTAR